MIGKRLTSQWPHNGKGRIYLLAGVSELRAIGAAIGVSELSAFVCSYSLAYSYAGKSVGTSGSCTNFDASPAADCTPDLNAHGRSGFHADIVTDTLTHDSSVNAADRSTFVDVLNSSNINPFLATVDISEL